MKHFLKKILSLLLLFAVAMIGVYFLSGFVAKKRLVKKGRAVAIDKTNRLQSLPSPKIVLIGGSNVCYGINAKMLQDSLHMPVVDMSINASVGMVYYYEQVKPYLHKGDVVIGIPEYGAYSAVNMYGEESLYNLCVIQPGSYKYLTPMQWLRFPLYLGDITKSNFKSLSENPNSDIANGRKFYDEHGSYFGHTGKPSLSSQWAATEKQENFKYKNNQVINASFINLVNGFAKFCKENNVVYMHSVPVYARQYYDSTYMNSIFKSLNGVTVINKPEQYLYEMKDMFDTPNHLLFEMKDERTKKLLHDIKAFLTQQSAK